MSKPIVDVVITTVGRGRARIKAVIDSGSFHTIVREDVLPKRANVDRYAEPRLLSTASRGGKIRMVGLIGLEVSLAGKCVLAQAFVSPDLNREMIVGAGTMQQWDISIVNRNGDTKVVVGRDMNDPEITEVDELWAFLRKTAASVPPGSFETP